MKRHFLLSLVVLCALAHADGIDAPFLSAGRAPDSSQKTISELRAAERRRIPIEVAVKAASAYASQDPVEVTVMITNLFDEPLLMNRRMLVNHPRLQGELSFRVEGPDGQRCEIKRLITPMTLDDEDFVVLPRGQSIQRSVDLSDLYAMKLKGMYHVTAVYHNEIDHTDESNLRAWKGVVASEPIEIRLN